MRLLFAHDHRFQQGANGELFTHGSFPAAVWDRYLEHFDELHVAARDGGALPPGTSLARADRPGVTFDFLPSLASLRQQLWPSRDVRARMEEAVRSADAVVARLPSEIGLLALRHARRLGKPHAVEVVGCAWDSYLNHGAIAARIYAPLAYLRMRRAVADAPMALYVTSSWLQQRYPATGHVGSASNVSLHPMDDDALERRRRRMQALARGEKPVLGTIASLQVRSKGVQTALAAVARLRRSGLDLGYRVLGPGDTAPWRRLAERLGIADLVHFDGTRSAGDEVFRWLDGIDIHLQPSFQEGLPRATIEAMSRGAACIGSTCGGIPELLDPERTHRPGDVGGLARCIRLLAENPDRIAAYGEKDRALARDYLPGVLHGRRRHFYSRLRDLADGMRAKS